jgi:two-component system phosphate regulon sensor histidine kinase PhoR
MQSRLAAAILLSIVPPVLLLIVSASTASVPTPWLVVAIGLSLVGGVLALMTGSRHIARSEESLEAMARALEGNRTPAYMALDGSIEGAQRHLFTAIEGLLRELDASAEQRDELDAILRSMREAVVVTGSGGEVVLINGAAHELFTLNPETDYRGRNFVELCRDPRLQEFVARSTAASDPQMISTELAIAHPRQGHLRVNAAPVRVAKGAAAARVLVFSDITDLKAYENVRADFVANLTHEVRTPLSALCGYAETLLRGVDDPETQHRFLDIIERQARRLARLIDDLLTLSDLERGLTPLKLEPVDSARLLEETTELMREPAQRHGVTIGFEVPAELPEVWADHDRLNQLMLNLLDNAIKYTPRGGRVTATARPAEDADAVGVELAVVDTGEGIPAAHIPRLTERFYRVDRARSRELGGTGLGLAIVKHIVQLHRGKLKIESRVREGTTVRVFIPCEQAPSLVA